MNSADRVKEIEQLASGKSEEEALRLIQKQFDRKVTFSTSFGLEDQVITHLVFSNNIPINIFTLDTGRNFNETYSVWSRTIDIYKKNIEVFFPKTETVENLLKQKGPFSFYESVENRTECCFIRKVEPLKRALNGYEVWITGIRKEQSSNRNNMESVEWDDQHKLVKFHPLFDWSEKKVKDFISKNNIPYNSLHDQGFPSIGCQPCTRAIKEGEDVRSGRWWWEGNTKKECGLHNTTAAT